MSRHPKIVVKLSSKVSCFNILKHLLLADSRVFFTLFKNSNILLEYSLLTGCGCSTLLLSSWLISGETPALVDTWRVGGRREEIFFLLKAFHVQESLRYTLLVYGTYKMTSDMQIFKMSSKQIQIIISSGG